MSKKLTAPQGQALWGMYVHGVLETFTPQQERHGKAPWLGLGTIQATVRLGYANVAVDDRWEVTAHVHTFRSPIMWRAGLTRAGQEWIAAEMVRIEGLTPTAV